MTPTIVAMSNHEGFPAHANAAPDPTPTDPSAPTEIRTKASRRWRLHICMSSYAGDRTIDPGS